MNEIDETLDAELSNVNRSVAERWTEVIASRGFTPVANMFLDRYAELEISTSEAMVLVHMVRHKWDKANPFPSAERIARRMGVTATAVRNHTRSLQKKGYLRKVAREGRLSEYDLTGLFEKLETAFAAGSPKPKLSG